MPLRRKRGRAHDLNVIENNDRGIPPEIPDDASTPKIGQIMAINPERAIPILNRDLVQSRAVQRVASDCSNSRGEVNLRETRAIQKAAWQNVGDPAGIENDRSERH
jgi:hypothetical protein